MNHGLTLFRRSLIAFALKLGLFQLVIEADSISLLVLSKQPDPSGVLMVDLTALLRRYHALQLSAEQVTAEVVHLHRDRMPRDGVAALVDLEDLAARGFDLTPALYV